MTKDQKTRIVRLRQMRRSYAEIGAELGMAKETVKTFCWRNNIKAADAPVQPKDGMCRECGKPLEQKPKMKKRVFCCKACSYKWWKEHPEKVNRKAVYTFNCACCGQPFTAYGNSKRKFCSHECYIDYRFKGGENDV